jgi:hypothetical protein
MKINDSNSIVKDLTDKEEVSNKGLDPTGETPPKKRLLNFLTLDDLKSYKPPEGHCLIGDEHIVRGAFTVIGGAPGVGKSRATGALIRSGCTGDDWFNLKVHKKFKTLVLQNENGQKRLKDELAEVPELNDDDFLICEPPECGLSFEDDDFRNEVREKIENFEPDIIVIDPWSAVISDDRQADYRKAFDYIRLCVGTGDKAPAIVIVAHTRKPKHEERANGRALLQMLAGSYMLGSVPRCAFVMLSASDSPTEQHVVWTCCKNNDGDHGPRGAFKRRNGIFSPVDGFDWKTFDNIGKNKKQKFGPDQVVEILMAADGGLTQGEIAEKGDVSQSTVSRAIKEAGVRIREANGCYSLRDDE